MRMLMWGLSAVFVLAGPLTPAAAQTFDAVGTRAAGMGGAFVAVADDASAAYWNPAGFASGSFFSFVLDRNSAELNPPGNGPAGSRSGLLLALGTPAVALSYYRLRSTEVTPIPAGGTAAVRAVTLVTHHGGATVVQSLAPGVAVGATLKLVRGQGSTRFDADLGVMTTFGRLKAGLTLRNATEPSFKSSAGATSLKLERQARAGVSVTPLAGWIVAADVDVLEARGPAGPARSFAAGTEGRVHRNAFVRGGFSVNRAGERAPAVSAGASFAATGSVLVDVQVTGGSDRAPRGWGVSARFGY